MQGQPGRYYKLYSGSHVLASPVVTYYGTYRNGQYLALGVRRWVWVQKQQTWAGVSGSDSGTELLGSGTPETREKKSI